MKKQKLIKNIIIVPTVVFVCMFVVLISRGVGVDILFMVLFAFLFIFIYFIYMFLYKTENTAQSKSKEVLYTGDDSQRIDEIFNMIAHQWRQPLSAISSSASTLEFKMLIGDYDKENFQTIIKDILAYSQHMSLTINEFRYFFKDSKMTNETSFESIIDECIDIINIGLRDTNIKIQIQNDYKETINIYENEFKQVVLNLLRNAQEAILQNGVLDGRIVIRTYKDNSDAVFEVLDNGGGIKEEILEKVFDPYFSTKDKKNSTGLGLYMSRVIVQKHLKGTLGCFNSENGAVFRIILPVNQ